jgi:hypothetical protein
MSRRRKTVLLLLPVLVLIIALLISGVGIAAPGKGGSDNGKGVIHQTCTAPSGTVYNAIYHVNNGKLTVTGAIYPECGPLK